MAVRMTATDRRRFWESLDKLSVAQVRKNLALQVWDEHHAKVARDWIAHQESSHASSSNEAMIEAARSANAIARDAVDSARLSADEARNSRWIAIGAVIAMIIIGIVSNIDKIQSLLGENHASQTKKVSQAK